MSIIIFIKILIVCLLGAVSPGPSMVVVMNNALFKNRFHGILTSLGHGFGIGMYALFAVLGIALIIKTNLFVFNGIKFISIIFLIYLGVKSIISKSKLDFGKYNLNDGITSFSQGVSISLLNPKIFIWFIAIYSQFMSVDNDLFFNTVLVLTAAIIDALCYITLTLLVTSKIALDMIKNKYCLFKNLLELFFSDRIFVIIEMLV